jgi:hypothetical protein
MRQKNLLTALLVSGAAAYFFDKSKGAERRTMVKDKVGSLLNSSRQAVGGRGHTGSALDRTSRDRVDAVSASGNRSEVDRTIDPTVANVW